MYRKSIATLLIASFMITGLSYPAYAAELDSTDSLNMESAAAEAEDDYPLDLFEESDNEEIEYYRNQGIDVYALRESSKQSEPEEIELTPVPDSEVESVLEPVISEPEEPEPEMTLANVTNTNELMSFIERPHDNSAYGPSEGIEAYIGQIALQKVAYCVSSETGIEVTNNALKRLETRLVRCDFIYPGAVEETHEYFDKDGTLLFSIDDMDFTGGKSTGKYRIYTPGMETGLEFYSDEVDISAVESYDQLGEGRKSEIGSRKHVMTEEEKKEIIDKNLAFVAERKFNQVYSLKELVNRYRDKWKEVKGVYIYAPESEFADSDGYVRISKNSKYVQKYMNMQFIRYPHTYSINNETNYIKFVDADGNQLFTINPSRKTQAVDVYRKNKTIEQSYYRGRVLNMYPADVDVEKAIEEEKIMVKNEQASKNKDNTQVVSVSLTDAGDQDLTEMAEETEEAEETYDIDITS